MTHRIGQIATVSGRLFKPLEATPDEIHIEDIAQALSLRCRYNCQIPEFYSVAQHVSMGVSTLYVNKCSTEVHDIEFARAWFLHDAAEAYLPDVAKYLKPLLPGFIEMEEKLLDVIFERFGLAGFDRNRLKELDNRMLATEIRDLQPKWPYDPVEHGEPFKFKITPMRDKYAKRMFLEDLQNLFPRMYWPNG